MLTAGRVAEPLDTTVAVEAPEQIRFRHRVAGPAQRVLAHLIDLLVWSLFIVAIWFVAAVASIGLGVVFGDVRGAINALGGFLMVVVFFALWLYFALFEGLWHGQTPGKRALDLRVVKVGGEPIGFLDAFLRNLLRAADILPFPTYGIGLLCMVIDPRFRRLGDLAAGTMVVVDERTVVAGAIQIPPATPQELASLPARVVLDPEDLRAVEMFLRRAPRLGAALAAELASRVAEPLGRRHGVQHADPSRLLALLYLRATAPVVARRAAPDARVPGAAR